MDRCHFFFVSVAEKPIMLIPAGTRRQQLNAIKFYRINSLKKRIFRAGIQLSIKLYLSRFLFEPVKAPTPFISADLYEWVKHGQRIFDCRDQMTLLIWPSESSKKRIYAYFIDNTGTLLGFAKVALNIEENENIQNEANTLNFFNTKELNNFKVPKLLRDDCFGDHRYILLEPVPIDARAVRLFSEKVHMKAIHEFAGMQRTVQKQDLESCSWVSKYQSALKVNKYFADDIMRMCQNQGIRICRIHGDFGPSNVLITKTIPWIIDWEESCPDGPFLTDMVSFILASRRKMVLRNPQRGLQFLLSEMQKLSLDTTKVDIAIALAFLHGSSFTLATKIIEAWPLHNVVWPNSSHQR